MSGWKKALLGSGGAGGGTIPAEAFYYFNDRKSTVPNPGMRLITGDLSGNMYHLTYRAGNNNATYNGSQNEYSLNLFDKDGNYQSTSYVWRSDISSSNSFMDSSSMNVMTDYSDGTVMVNGFMEAAYISAYYPGYFADWSESNFTTAPDDQFALSATNFYFFNKDPLHLLSSGDRVVRNRYYDGSSWRLGFTKFNAAMSSVSWTKYWNQSWNGENYSTVDDNDNVYIVATSNSYRSFGVIKVNSSGALQWAREIGNFSDLEVRGCTFNPTSGDLIMVAQARYVDGNNDRSSIIVSLDVSSGTTVNWCKFLHPADDRNLYPGNPCVDEDGNIYMLIRGYGMYSPSGYMYSWGCIGVFSCESDGTARWANGFDPNGKNNSHGQNFQGCDCKSLAYDPTTGMVLGAGESNEYGSNLGAFAFRIFSDGSGTDVNTEYQLGSTSYYVCYYSWSIDNSSGNLTYGNETNYINSNNAWSGTWGNASGTVTNTSLSLSDGNTNDSSNMQDSGPIS